MKIKFFLLVLATILFAELNAQMSEWDWVNMSNLRSSISHVDQNNNIYSICADWGTGYSVLVKFDSLGNELWTESIIGGSYESKFILQNDFLYIIGDFEGYVIIDDTTLFGEGSSDVYFAKINLEGNLIWASQVGGVGADVGNSIAVNENEEIIISGNFNDILTLGNYTLESNGFADIFLIKYSTDGSVIWARSGGGENNDTGESVAVSSGNNIYLVGGFGDSAFFNDSLIISNGSLDAFIAKYSNDGDLLWLKNYGYNGGDRFVEIKINTNDELFIGGRCFDQYFTGGYYIFKFDSNGNYLWSDGSGGIFIESIDIYENNYVYATGYVIGAAHFNNYTVFTDSMYFQNQWVYDGDVIVVKYDQSGNFKSIAHVDNYGDWDSQYGQSVTVFDTNNVYVSGVFNGCGDFSGLGVHCQDGSFLGKLNFVDLLTDVKEEADTDLIRFFPNPARGYLNIELSSTDENNYIEVINIQGNIIKSIRDARGQSLIDINDIPVGIYLIKVFTDKGIVMKKLIKH